VVVFVGGIWHGLRGSRSVCFTNTLIQHP
jgi:hypothetical protein